MADQEPESQSAETSEEQASAETPQNASNAEGAEPDSGDTAVEKSTESKEPENTESDTPNTVLPDELPAEAEGSATKEAEYSATKQTEDDTTKETEDGATKETEDGATKETEDGSTKQTEDGSTKQTEDGATKQTEDGEVVTVEQSEEVGEAPAEDPTKQAATPEQGKVQEKEIKADVVAEEGTGDTEPGQVAEEPQEVVNQPAETADEAAAPRSVSQSPAVLAEVAVKEGEPDLLEGDLPQPGTPEKEGSIAGEEELLMVEEEEPVPEYNREELLQQYQAVLQEREQLNTQNRNLQHRLSDYYSKKKSEESRQEVDKNASDQEQRYMKYMSNIEELRQQQAVERQVYNEQLEEMKEKKMEKQKRVDEEWSKSIEFKKAVALAAINSRSGRPIHPKDLEVYEANEKKKEGEVSQVRLENIKLKNRLKKQESQLKQKEELAEGLHLIDFEQLKIENQTYNEKIEERNEELLKLRKKITSTVQVLTHLKEKLQFVQAENFIGKEQLSDVEKDVAQKRDILSRTKQARDALRHENNKLQQKCGLLGNTDLLRDFEVGTDEADSLEVRLDMLKRVHAELTLNLNGIKKKIELAKENQS